MQEFEKFFENKGNFISVEFESPKVPSAIHKGKNLLKKTKGVFRAGISFGNLGEVKDAIANGERGEVQPLKWGKWLKFPYLIEHNGEVYVRLYPTANCKIEVEYNVDNKVVTKEQFNSFLRPSDIAESGEVPQCLTIKASNIKKLG